MTFRCVNAKSEDGLAEEHKSRSLLSGSRPNCKCTLLAESGRSDGCDSSQKIPRMVFRRIFKQFKIQTKLYEIDKADEILKNALDYFQSVDLNSRDELNDFLMGGHG